MRILTLLGFLFLIVSTTGCFGLLEPDRNDMDLYPVIEDEDHAQWTGRFAELALDAIHREYPNKLSFVLDSPQDLGTPSQLHPVFYGSFDWHSSVHTHWLLVRLLRTTPSTIPAEKARQALRLSFVPEKVRGEVAYFNKTSRTSFERPYGLAWLLCLSAELHEWEDPESQEWARALDPLVEIAVRNLKTWFPKLTHPIRTGEHSQTAFAMGLILDWARSQGDHEMEDLVVARGRAFYGNDKGWSFDFEPGGQDFLSPGLAEADFMRRIYEPREFAKWLRHFLPQIPSDDQTEWFSPAVVTDKSDGKLAHLDGVNISRAWMMEGVIAGLPADDPRSPALRSAATLHRRLGLASVTGEDYAGGHWLGSFATYLVTRRGLQ